MAHPAERTHGGFSADVVRYLVALSLATDSFND